MEGVYGVCKAVFEGLAGLFGSASKGAGGGGNKTHPAPQGNAKGQT